MEHWITLPVLGTMRVYIVVMLVMLMVIIWPRIKPPVARFLGRMRRIKTPVATLELEAESNALKTGVLEMDKTSAALAARIGRNSEDLRSLESRMAALETLMLDINVNQKKHMVFDEKLPMEERMYAGLNYVSLGGNHRTKGTVIEMCKDNPALYRMATKSSPHLAIDELKNLH